MADDPTNQELSEAGRDAKGRFAKGNKFKPPTAHRKKQPDMRPLLAKLDKHFPPTVIVSALEEILEKGGQKVRLEAVKYINDLRYGKPVGRNINANIPAEDFAALFIDQENVDMDDIEVEYEVEGDEDDDEFDAGDV